MRILILFAVSLIANSIIGQSFFSPIQDSDISLRSDQERTIVPNHYQALALDIEGIKNYLGSAPHELDGDRVSQEVSLKVPMPDGTFKTFMIYEAPTMMEEISDRYPNIKSYKGYGRSNDYENLRISLNSKGFYAAIRTLNGTVYIDPYSTNTTTEYISYFVKDHEVQLEPHQMACGTTQDPESILDELKDIEVQGGQQTNVTLRGDNIPLRQYRLAIACTGEFGQIRANIEEVLADINTTVTRLNQIFENDLSIRMILVDRNDEIIYDNPQTDPYAIPTSFPDEDTGSGRWLLARNTGIINNTIGTGSYDLGHIYHRQCTDVGGVAFLGSICGDLKGGGVTCHSPFETLEHNTISIAAHEMGHQLGSPHSFNNCRGDNQSPPDGFEPGSGTTIMSYAGLCGSNNVQSYNDDYYHVGSLINIYRTTRDGAQSCAEEINIDNHEPDVELDYTDGFYIPINTPFILTGNATDEDGNNMTYSWEQVNSGPLSTLGSPLNDAPGFRVYYPDENKTRIFPKSNFLLSNSSSQVEVLATYNRNYNFQFVVRDNNPGGGTASWEEISFFASDVGGPFLVTSNNTNDNMSAGDEHMVTWEVAGTDLAPINCQNVNIYISYDSEINTDAINDDLILLAENTPNDGSHAIVIPTRLTTRARIVVRAADNIFFDVSDRNNTVEEPSVPTVYFEAAENNLALCSDTYGLEISTQGLGGYEGEVRMEIEGLPAEAEGNFTATTVMAGESTTLNLDFSNVLSIGNYELKILAIAEGIDSLERIIPISNIATDFSDLAYIGPENGIKGYTSLPTLEWTLVQNAFNYKVEIATNPGFAEATIVHSAIVTNTNYTPSEILEVSSIYYWRVRAENDCRQGGYPDVYAFSTESLSCQTYEANNLPKNISQSGTPSILAEIPVSGEGQVADVNVKLFKGLHERNKDLTAYLQAPDGVRVKLFGNKCGNQSNFNCAFDDESPSDFSCPLNSQETYKPEVALSELNGKEIAGLWIFQLDDNVTGNSGKLEEVTIELCSNVSLNPPVLVNNNVLELPPGARDIIQSPQMLTTDPDNTFDQLVYTLVTAPEHGQLQLNLVTLQVGDQWTQNDIQFNNLTYIHSDDGSESDMLRFDVVDGQGGWVEITNFDISIDDSFTTSTLDNEFDNEITLYPNPANESVFINHNTIDLLSIKILDLAGRTMSDHTTNRTNRINTSNIDNGVYLVEIISGEKKSVKKMVIQR